jgi:ubiquitin carboxyl-terminal hydrolase 7
MQCAATAAALVLLQVFNFGDPFIFLIGSEETAASVRERIRTKLNVPAEDFAKWKLAYVSIRGGAEFLADDEVPAQRFAKSGLESQHYLGLGHEDKGPKRPASTARHNAYVERPVKIYN